MAFHTAGLIVALGFLAASRTYELFLSHKNERTLKSRGGYEAPGSQMPLFVALHVAAPVAMVVEVIAAGARPHATWPVWLTVWVLAEWLRDASMRALGDRWSTRIIVVPGEPLVRRGPYRYIPHPIYLAVTLELTAMPLLFGAWRTAIGACLVNALLLASRIRREHAALTAAARTSATRTAPERGSTAV